MMFAIATYHLESYTYPAVQPDPVSLNVTLCNVGGLSATVVVLVSVLAAVFNPPSL